MTPEEEIEELKGALYRASILFKAVSNLLNAETEEVLFHLDAARRCVTRGIEVTAPVVR